MSKVIPIKQVQAYAEQTVDYRQVLSQSEIDAIEHECALYESRPAAAIDALQIVQRERRWISDESLYSISCWLNDFQTIADHLRNTLNVEFGQTTSDGNITLLPNVCLGCCNKAPALMLDGELIENLDIASIDKLLQSLGGGKNE